MIRDLIAAVHVYLREQKSPDTLLLSNVARYVTEIFRIFGVIPAGNVIGFPSGLNDVNVSFCLNLVDNFFMAGFFFFF